MTLSKDQQKELLATLISAFPDEQQLAMIVSLKLDEKLNNITSSDNHPTRVFYLIEWAESQGKLDDLIQGVYEFNPNNPKMRDFYNKYYNIVVAPTSSPVTPTQTSILQPSPASLPIFVPAKYEKLQKLLAAGEWKIADEETARVMLQVAGREEAGWLDRDSIEKFPCEDLRTIDQLWVKYSNGRFGFSVQKNIWLECGGKVDWETECKLGDRLEWRVKGEWIDYDEGTFSLKAPFGHLPLIDELVLDKDYDLSCDASSLASRAVSCNI